MLISNQTDVLGRKLGEKEAIRVLAAAGFDAFDYSVFDIRPEKNPLYADGWREYVAGLKMTAAKAGIVCNQAHAPFPSTKTDDAYNKTIFDCITRAMEGAALLGAKAIVVHPCQHVPYLDNVRYLFDYNMDFYRSLAPYAKRFGIRVALENMWQVKDGKIVDSTCASPEEFAAYLDTLADDCFTACLDLGHSGLCGREAADMIRYLGAERLTCLHIHDNDYKHDSHTLPYSMNMKWDTILAALHEIGYKGDFTYEADNFLGRFPADFLPEAEAFMAKLARRMVKDIE